MKQPKKLTRSQKQVVSGNSLDCCEWMLVEETELYLQIINKLTGETRYVEKVRKRRKR